MRCPIHVDDIVEVFARVLLTERPIHRIYNSGGIAISLGEIADLVRPYLPDAKIGFEKESGGREASDDGLRYAGSTSCRAHGLDVTISRTTFAAELRWSGCAELRIWRSTCIREDPHF